MVGGSENQYVPVLPPPPPPPSKEDFPGRALFFNTDIRNKFHLYATSILT